MLGQRGIGFITQASFIRSLMATFLRAVESKQARLRGLFASVLPNTNDVLPWKVGQQAVFIIECWRLLKEEALRSRKSWIEALRKVEGSESVERVVFEGRHSLLASDQGVRGVLAVLNDMCYVASSELKLNEWVFEGREPIDEAAVTDGCRSLCRQSQIIDYLAAIARQIVSFDWRAASAPGLSEKLRIQRMAFKGSTGYKELRRHLVEHLTKSRDARVASHAVTVKRALTREKD